MRVVIISAILMAIGLTIAVTGGSRGAGIAPAPLTAEIINAAPLDAVPQVLDELLIPGVPWTKRAAPKHPDPSVARLQILLDRAGASPGVIDGYDGDNVRKAVLAFEAMHGLTPDGAIDPDFTKALDDQQPVVGLYTIAEADLAEVGPPVPEDYAEKAKLSFLGYASAAEALAERFHMDQDFLVALNPAARFATGEEIYVAITGPDRIGLVVRIGADKTLRQVRAYDAAGALLAAYPATIGSTDNPSPTGSYTVVSATPMPTYTYNPKINFQQGDNTEVLTIPPGPNGPVGSMWIALSKPTYGIHGTPDPSRIDKTGSHGCIRLTNWDATELAGMVQPGVTVEFLG